MRVFLGRFRQQPSEILDYSVDYSQWLPAGETVVASGIDTSPVTDPPLGVSNQFINDDGNLIGFRISEGLSGSDYQLTIKGTTSVGQLVEREFNITVEEQ